MESNSRPSEEELLNGSIEPNIVKSQNDPTVNATDEPNREQRSTLENSDKVDAVDGENPSSAVDASVTEETPTPVDPQLDATAQPATTGENDYANLPSAATTTRDAAEAVSMGHVSTQTDSSPSTPRVEASVQAEPIETATSDSTPLITLKETVIESNQLPEQNVFYNCSRQLVSLLTERSCNVPRSFHTVWKNKYTLSSMLLYMIMTTVFSRLIHINPTISNMYACSQYQGILSLNAVTLLALFISLSVQVILDTLDINDRCSFIFNVVMSTIQILLHLVFFERIYWCQSSFLDYGFPVLTLFMCIGYTCLITITTPKLMGGVDGY